jgi:hypothetical protein
MNVFNIGDRVIVVADYREGSASDYVGKIGVIKDYDAVFDHRVRLDNPLVVYPGEDSATGFDENELALYEGE